MRQHAVVRVLPGETNQAFDFSVPWRGLEKNFVLLPAGQDQSVSVESMREDADLGLRVEFCATEFCEGIAETSPVEAWFIIRGPFAIGARTRLRIEIPTLPGGLPDQPLIIDCRGGSCVEGTEDAAVLDAEIFEDSAVIMQESGVSDAGAEAGEPDAATTAMDASTAG